MSALARLLEQATPGPWDPCWLDDAIIPVPDMRLALLVPDMARLLIDMATALEVLSNSDGVVRSGDLTFRRLAPAEITKPLLARFAELEQRAAP